MRVFKERGMPFTKKVRRGGGVVTNEIDKCIMENELYMVDKSELKQKLYNLISEDRFLWMREEIETYINLIITTLHDITRDEYNIVLYTNKSQQKGKILADFVNQFTRNSSYYLK
jgi:hypothetical protein